MVRRSLRQPLSNELWNERGETPDKLKDEIPIGGWLTPPLIRSATEIASKLTTESRKFSPLRAGVSMLKVMMPSRD